MNIILRNKYKKIKREEERQNDTNEDRIYNGYFSRDTFLGSSSKTRL
jgi:hypothetical protein